MIRSIFSTSHKIAASAPEMTHLRVRRDGQLRPRLQVPACHWLVPFLALVLIPLSGCMFTPEARKHRDFERAKRDVDQERYSEASIELMKAIKLDPGYTEAHAMLADVFLHLQRPGNAVQEFNRILELKPGDAHTRLELIELLTLGRDVKDAQPHLDLLLKQQPTDPEVHMAASNLQVAQGHLPESITEAEKAVALAPNEWKHYLSLGVLQGATHQPDLAEASFKKAIALDPSAVQPRLMLGNLYWSQQRSADAEQQFREAMAAAPTLFAPRQALAQLYLAEQKPDEAEKVLEQAAQQLPGQPDAAAALTSFYLATGKSAKALEATAALYHAHPADLGMEHRYIVLLIAGQHYDEAHRLNEEILKKNPMDSAALIARGRMQLVAGDKTGATHSFQDSLQHSPSEAEAHFMLGIVAQSSGDLVREQSEMTEAAKLSPNNPQVQRELARIALRTGDMTALGHAATQLIRMAPKAAEGYALRAISEINLQHYAEAEQDVAKTIEVDPANSAGYLQQGNLRAAQNRLPDAAAAYRQALDRNPTSADALRGLMSVLVAQKQPDKAIAAAQEQLAKSPANAALYNLLGQALFRLKHDLPGAEAAFQKSVLLDKSNPDPVGSLCMVRAARGQMDSAMATAQQYLSQNPPQIRILNLLGGYYQAKSQWQQAADTYRKALALDQLNPMANNELARVELRTGQNPDQALELAQTALKGFQEAPIIYDTIGWAYYNKGAYQVAIQDLNIALNLEKKKNLPDIADVHFHMAMAYEKTHAIEQAREEFHRAIEIDPQLRNAAKHQMDLVGQSL